MSRARPAVARPGLPTRRRRREWSPAWTRRGLRPASTSTVSRPRTTHGWRRRRAPCWRPRPCPRSSRCACSPTARA
eukprot:1755249-Alexandrium_andersonii.AAC.1